MKTLQVILLILSVMALKAQEPVLLKDFNTRGADAFDYDPEIVGITVNNQLYFLADDGRHGEELWRTNGTSLGTQLLKDINPDEESSYIKILGTLNDIVFFSASDGTNGYELWVTTGTTSGTQMIELLPGPPGSGPSDAAILDNKLYFSANGDKGRELYRTEGTAETTTLVRDIDPRIFSSDSPFGSYPSKLTTVGDIIFFTASDEAHGTELWKTNGTFAGTLLVKDINGTQFSSSISQLYGGSARVYFLANDGVHGMELWTSDGTEGGTFMLKDITSGPENSGITFMEEVNGTFYFIVRESNIQRMLWKTDGTEEGTVKVDGDINTRNFLRSDNVLYFRGNGNLWKADGETEEQIEDMFFHEEFGAAGGFLYFSSRQAGSGNALWKTDGTAGNATKVKEITQRSYEDISFFQGVGDIIYFLAETDDFGNEIWVSDGTEEGTIMLLDGEPGEGDGFPTYGDVQYGIIGDILFFTGMDPEHGRELWRSEGTTESTQLVKDINSGTQNIVLYNHPVAYDDHTFFITPDGLWKTGGTPENTELILDTNLVNGLNIFNDKLFFTAPAEGLSRTIWSGDGTPEGTQPLFNTATMPVNHFIFEPDLPQANGLLYFYAYDSDVGFEIWKTDGTVAGTGLLKDILEGPNYSNSGFNGQFAVVDDILYFRADDGILGPELWKTDGTEEGTVPVTDINPFGGSSILYPVAIGNDIYFFADDGTAGSELWKTNTISGNTVMVKDIYPGEESGIYGIKPVSYKGMLFFAGKTEENGIELWKSDGTPEGTVMVRDIWPAQASGIPNELSVFGDNLYFIAKDGQGIWLWKSDGTTAGTVIVSDLPAQNKMIEIDGTLFFTAEGENKGYELWRLPPGAEDPVLVSEMNPGTGSSSPKIQGFYSGSLYFTAIDATHGRELWTLTPEKPEASVDMIAGDLCNPEDTVTFVADVTSAGDNPEYEWYVNNIRAEEENTNTFSAAGFADGDEVKVLAIAGNGTWIIEDSAYSKPVTVSFDMPAAEISLAGNTLTASAGASYQWFLNGSLMPDVTQSITVQQSGTYQTEITNAGGCSALSDEVNVTIINNALENKSLAGSINIYPNPATSYLFIDCPLQEKLKFIIYDISGVIVLEKTLYPQENHRVVPLDGIQDGVYLMRLTGESGSYQSKLIKL